MTALTTVLSALNARDCNPRGSDDRGYMALCPAHDDRTPSLGVTYRDGKVLMKCYADCPTGEVVAALGLRWTDLFDGSSNRIDRPTHRLVRVSEPPALRPTHDLFEEW